jgi:hypothetical protein
MFNYRDSVLPEYFFVEVFCRVVKAVIATSGGTVLRSGGTATKLCTQTKALREYVTKVQPFVQNSRRVDEIEAVT